MRNSPDNIVTDGGLKSASQRINKTIQYFFDFLQIGYFLCWKAAID